MSFFQAILDADAAILLFIQENIHCGFLDGIMKALSFIGDSGAVWIALGIVLLCFKKTRMGGLFLLASLAMATVVNNLVLKNLVARPRPYTTIDGLVTVIEQLSSYSFPSGHSASSFASATALTLAFGKKGAWAFIPASLIAISRVYNGVHYPTDIICGAAVGALVSLGVCLLLRRIIPPFDAEG